ncbi:MAG TPA: hypothetical protein VFB61_17185 [Gemmatimonadales bacterium]|nr:hypothetical protein [Gemmatimonadales bacterium]
MAEGLKREVLWLVGAVLLVDALFVATYFLAGLRSTTDAAKVAFTMGWTLVTLVVVLRGLSRIRRVRFESKDIRL